MRNLLIAQIGLGLISSAMPFYAGEYDALCENLPCKIFIDEKGLNGPAGFIPAHRVAVWVKGGWEEHDEASKIAGASAGVIGGSLIGGLATCWTIIFCPSGIMLGGYAGGAAGSTAGKSTDFHFTVVGYNDIGEKTIQSFSFVNKKPVARVTQELPIFTGLRMGEQRSIEDIKKGDELN